MTRALKIRPRHLVVLGALAVHAHAVAQMQCVAPAQSSLTADAIARGYLIQKVCADSSQKALPIDPCQCGSPNHLRDLQVGESLPYHKLDQTGIQRHDSYPIRTLDGREEVANPFDFTPFEKFNLWGDGYDIYLVRDGWVSASETRDGSGFSQTFFSEGCKAYNGWAFFPLSALSASGLTAGRGTIGISGRYWEQNGEAWPGSCPRGYNKGTLTTWDWNKGFGFGGKDPAHIKVIDTIRAVHGLSPDPRFQKQGHLEVFFFTQLYGITRWEVWTPESQGGAPENKSGCSGDGHITYEGQQFVRAACHDWSAISISKTPDPVPVWPIPELNLLKNFHFADGVTHWDRKGKSAEGNLINWSLRNSTSERDTHFRQEGGRGVGYLAINCGGKCTEGEMIFQDVPVASSSNSRMYGYAATVRSESGPGKLRITLTQLDANGAELSSAGTTADVDVKNERISGDVSILLSSIFVTGSVAINPQARTLRFSIAPVSGETFDVADAWVMPN